MVAERKSLAFAVAIAAVALCSCAAFAATPTAVWDCEMDGMGLDTTQNGYSISKSSVDTFSNGKLIVGTAGGNSLGSCMAMPNNNIHGVSVLVKYSNGLGYTGTTYRAYCMAARDSASHELGITAKGVESNVNFFYISGSLTYKQGPAMIPESGYMLFSYATASGIGFYSGETVAGMAGATKSDYKFGEKYITQISIGGEKNVYNSNWSGLVVEKVALFVEQNLSASDVADYRFPSDYFSGSVTVSEINAKFGADSEIDVYLTDGAAITGDAAFNATKVNFHCSGSFSIAPPSGNEAEFDFSGVTGRPTIVYDAVLPTVVDASTVFTSGSVPGFVTDETKWAGTICLKNLKVSNSKSVTDFTVNDYGNESSVVRLEDVEGWLKAPGNYAYTNVVPVEIAGTVKITNGNSANDSNPNRCTVFKKVTGSGTIETSSGGDRVVVVIQDATGFTGGLGLSYSKFIVFGQAMPEYASVVKVAALGTVYVMPGAKVVNGGYWWATGGISVGGELCVDDPTPGHQVDGVYKGFGGGTAITTADSGVLTVTAAGGARQFDIDYSKIGGTGTLKLEGSNWFTLPTNSTISTDLKLEVARDSGTVIPPGGITVGNLSGSKNLRSDLELVEQGATTYRNLTIVQSKDTEWSGIFAHGDRVDTVYVVPGATSGTLTLSGTQTQNNNLNVAAGAKVELTGTWKGATTVAGTLSGTGTVDGNLTLSAGATLEVGDVTRPISVTGNFSAPGDIAIVLPEGTHVRHLKVLSVSGSSSMQGARVYVGGELADHLRAVATSSGLKISTGGYFLRLR